MATLEIAFVSESAGYSNTLGWYNTRTGEAGILFLDTNDLAAGTTATLDVLQSDIDAGYIGFFLIPDGADRYRPSVLEGPLSFDTLGNGTGVIRDEDGRRLVGAQGEVIFTDDSLNKKDVDYTLGDDDAGGILGTIAFEDLVKKSDRDFNDLVIDVRVVDDGANRPPVVEDQAFALAENSAAGTVVGTVAAADPDAGQALSYAIVGGNDGNLFEIDSTTGLIRVAGSLDFEAATGHTLTVSVSDGALSDTATITIGVTNVNEPVTAADDGSATIEDLPLALSAADLLANDSDADGTTSVIAAVGDAVNGTVTLDAGGNVVFTPDEDYSGPASFSYTITDGEFSDTAQVHIEVAAAADAPELTVADASGVGDNAVPLFIGVALADPSETLGAVSIDGVPDDWALSAGVRDETTGIYALTADELVGLSIDPPAGASGSVTLTVVATSSEAGDTASTTAQFTVAITQLDAFAGKVIDGYIAGATVFADTDEDGELDAGEASATTDASGNFTLLDGTGPLVMSGGTDVSTGLAFTGVLRAPAGSTVVTPLTTLVAALVDGGQTLAQATENVKSALGVDASVDLLNFDPVPAAVAGDTTAAQVLAAGIQVQNVISQASALLAGAGATDPGAALTAELVVVVAAGAPVDLSSATTTQALISDAASATAVNVAAVVADAATVLAEANGLAADAAASADVTALAQVAAVAQSAELTSDLADAGAANDPGTLATDYTGASLQAQVDNAQVGDVDGALLGTIGNDVLVGGAGNDAIDGLAGNDVLDGQAGDDQLFGGPGRDTLRGGTGDDVLDGGVLADFQSTEGFIDQDRADYSGASGAVAVDLASGIASDGDAGTDTLSGIEHVTGSAFADTLSGSDAFYETFTGGAGNDTINGDLGQDRAEYADATGAISVHLGSGSVTGDASVGNDTLIEVEQVMGSAFADHYDATGFTSHSAPGGLLSAFNSFDGLAGDDTIVGNGSTRVSYVNATGAVNVDLAAGTATGDASVGTDTFAGVNQVRGSNFGDTLAGGNPASNAFESFEGRGGDDTISGGAGFDRAVYAFDGPVSSGITVNLAAGTVAGDPVFTGIDTLSSIEFVQGSFQDDVFDATGFSGASANAGSSGTFNEFEGMAGNDTIIGNGNTRISYLNAREAVEVNLVLGTAAGGASVGTDTVSGVSQVRGSNFDDVLIGLSHGIAAAHVYEGRGGDDLINGNGGFDQAAYHNDFFTSTGITVEMASIDASTGVVIGDSHIGTDTITGIASVRGTAFADTYNALGFNSTVTGITTFNEFDGGGGDDTITGNGNTRLTYINATDGVTVDLDAGTAAGDASVGNDTFTGVSQVRGSNHDDTLLGSAGNDTFEGRGGNDAIDGRGGFDTARYDAANGPGTFIWNAAGTVMASAGGQGTDALAGVEAVRGTNFDDAFDASATFLAVQQEGLGGHDQLTGGSGADTLLGGFGDDTLLGNLGGDRLVGGAGNDHLDGGIVNDLQSVAGFLDLDRADYGGAFGPVVVDLQAGTALDGEGGLDTLTNIESVTGSGFNDELRGSDAFFEVFVGGSGDDIIDGRGGGDRVDYSGSFDGMGIDVDLTAGAVTGGFSVGSDTLIGIEQVFGTFFDDTYDATGFVFTAANGVPSPNNSFDPLGGDDTITGNGYTRISYSTLNAGVTVDLAAGVVDSPFTGMDTFTGVNSVRGSNFDDVLIGSAADEFFEGRSGSDQISGGGGFDTAIFSFDGPVAVGINVDLAAGTVSGDFRNGLDTLSSVEAVRGSFQDDTFDATGFSGASANAGSNGTLNEFEGMAGNDTIVGNGNTRISYSQAREAVTVNLATGMAIGGASVGTDMFTGVNAVRGSNFDDVLIGVSHGIASAHVFEGGGGDDAIDGAGGFDQAAYHNDFTSTGISVHMSWDGDPTTGRVFGDAAIGTDTITGIASVRGTVFADTYDATGFVSATTGLFAFNEFNGGGGDDVVFGNFATRLTYLNATDGVTVDMVAGTADGDASVGHDTFSGVSQVRGSNFDDFLFGSFGNDTFEGRGGNDLIDGRGGFDLARYDFALGGGSFTWAVTGAATASVADHGVDMLHGIEAVRGTNFDDVFDASAAFVPLQLEGMGGDDQITGGSGADNLMGGAGNDALLGNLGADRLVGGAGDDFMDGGIVADLQSVEGFLDIDRVDYSGALAPVMVDLQAGTASDGEGGNDTLLNIENVTGSAFDDTLLGSGILFEIFVGGAGDDFIDGRGGADRVDYSGASDGIGIDVDLGAGTVSGGASVGHDTLVNVEQLFGTSFNDTYDATGVAFGNSFDPGGGDDLIIGNGSTRLSYSNVGEGVIVDLNAGVVNGGFLVGTDTFSGVNSVRGSNFADTLIGTGADELFEGRGGDDAVHGGGGFDTAIYAFDGPVAVNITVALAAGTVTGDLLRSGIDMLSGVEAVRGSIHGDFFDATGFSASSANAGSLGALNEFEGMAGNDSVLGNGSTRISYSQAREAVMVNLDAGTAAGGASVGTDTILGGVDAVRGSNFDDTLIGRTAGHDRLAGGAGNDTIDGGILADFKSTAGFSDTDIADYSGANGPVNVDLATGSAADGQGGTDTLSGIESVVGSAHDDLIAGSNAYGEYFEGGAGNDIIDGRGGFDHSDYGNATGGIAVDLTAGTVTGDASVGSDLLIDVEEIFGTDFADTYVATGYASASLPGGATTGFNSFEGGGGDDQIIGNGDTRVEYVNATSAVTVDLGAGFGAGDASVGTDTFVSGVSAVRGSSFNDTLIGGTGNRFESFDGWGGDDFIDGLGGFDRVDYGFHGPLASGIFVDLANGVVTGDPLATGTDTIRSVESVRGTYLADTFNAGGFGFFGANFGSNGTFNEFEGMAGDDTVFGNGNTRVSYVFARDAVTVNLAEGRATGDDSVGTDTLFGISQVRGSSFNDTLIGVNHGIAQAHIYEGRGGDDFINGNGGFDQAAYHNDLFTTVGISVNMASIDASTGQVIGDSHIGTDTITGIASARGTAFADTYSAAGFNSSVTGLGTFNEFDGGAGNDVITGNGNTRITYINATAGVTVDLGNGVATGDASVGSDTFSGVNQVRGSNFDDNLLGSGSNDIFEGRGGNDTIDGLGGFDTARYDAAGAGGSFVWSGTGTLTANVPGQGFDTLSGIEQIRGTNFDDLYDASADAGGVNIQGNAGNDRLVSGAGNDFFHGGFEFDLQSVIGFTDNDRVDYSAATGSVMVNLDVGVATGGGGFDTFQFVESVTGSSFDDHLIGSGRFFETFVGGAGNDIIDGAGGTDRADYSGALEGISVDMGSGIVTGGGSVGTDTLISVEQLFGTNFDDTYNASAAFFGNSFDPLGGDDTIIGNGNTRLSYSTLGEAVTVDLGSGVVTGALAGTDTFSGVNSVRGSNFDDMLIGTDADETFEGRSGNDFIDGSGGFDTAIFSFDGPVGFGISVDLGAGTVSGDFRNGFETLRSIESVRGSFQSDFFDATGFSSTSANAGSFGTSNQFEGMAGNDTIVGNGSTTLSYASAREGVSVDMASGLAFGGASVGVDSFAGVFAVLGSNFDDTLRGSDGDDALLGGGGNDVMAGGRGTDFINLAGGGADRVDFDSADEGIDVVFNFDELSGDVLDIADLLDNSTIYGDGAGGALEDFVQYAAAGGDGLLSVDVDGAAGPASWETIANVLGRSDATLESLLSSGGLDIIS